MIAKFGTVIVTEDPYYEDGQMASSGGNHVYDVIRLDFGDNIVDFVKNTATPDRSNWMYVDFDIVTNAYGIFNTLYEGEISNVEWTTPLSPISDNPVKILWSGASHMDGSQSITLSEAISAQKTGIQLIFSSYENNVAVNDNWNTFFVSKLFATNISSNYMTFVMSKAIFENMATKSIVVNDTILSGFTSNITASTSASGITYDNSKWVLRYVIGV